MLKNLWKNEIKEQGRTMCGLYAVIVVSAILISGLKLWERHVGGTIVQNMYAFAFVLYVATVIGLVIAGFIYLCTRFYQTMYSAQGYLTHTLPVKTTQILNVKIIVSAAYLFLTGIIAAVSFAVIGMIDSRAEITELIQALFTEMDEAGLGISGIQIVMFLLVLMGLGCIDALLMFFAGSSIGQLAKRSRGVCGIAASVGLYYITQIISLLMVVIFAFFWKGNAESEAAARWGMAGGILLAIFWAAVYYAVNRIIVQRHLNLE